jgi:DNA polymerase III alpha subunit
MQSIKQFRKIARIAVKLTTASYGANLARRIKSKYGHSGGAQDETGIANAIITPAVYEQFKQVVVYKKFLLIEGELQNQENVISVKAATIRLLAISAADVRSHDFH